MMGTQIEGLIFAVLVILAALGWLVWQRYMNRFELPEDNESNPSKEELERQMVCCYRLNHPIKRNIRMVLYITLFAAVGFEVAGTMLLPLTQNFQNPYQAHCCYFFMDYLFTCWQW